MREIVVISGKGGTGKTSVSAALAALIPNVLLCDLDVDAPDLHIILDPRIQRREVFFSGNEAEIRRDLCVQCGKCAEICRFDAIVRDEEGYHVNSMRCEGCGVCVALCPARAIAFPERECGEWYISETRFGPMVHAQLYPGQENSGRLISLLKQEAHILARQKGSDWVLCDGSPGVGCPVISSLSGAQLAIAVVEPTPSGRHDFQRVAELCDHFRIPLAVIINKADLNAEQSAAIQIHAEEKGYSVVGSLPFDPAVTQAMIQRKALTEIPSPMADTLAAIWQNIDRLATTAASGKRNNTLLQPKERT